MATLLIIADDHPVTRAGLSKILQTNNKFEVILEASNGEELLKSSLLSKAEILLLDVNMPGADGLTLVPKLKNINPELKIVIFTMYDGEGYFREALNLGVNGYILKSESLVNLGSLLERIINGEFYCTPPLKVAGKGIKSTSRFKISGKEHEVLTMLVNGFTAKEIGERMGLSKRTVEYYSRKLKEKFDAENLVELVNHAKKDYFR